MYDITLVSFRFCYLFYTMNEYWKTITVLNSIFIIALFSFLKKSCIIFTIMILRYNCGYKDYINTHINTILLPSPSSHIHMNSKRQRRVWQKRSSHIRVCWVRHKEPRLLAWCRPERTENKVVWSRSGRRVVSSAQGKTPSNRSGASNRSFILWTGVKYVLRAKGVRGRYILLECKRYKGIVR